MVLSLLVVASGGTMGREEIARARAASFFLDGTGIPLFFWVGMGTSDETVYARMEH